MRRLISASIVLTLITGAQLTAQERVDLDMAARIRSEGMERSKALDVFNHLVTIIGPRLTASPPYKASVDWTRAKLAEWGLDNVHLEPWEFGRGWTLDRFSIEMIEPRYMPMIGHPVGWSAPTSGKLTAQPVWLGDKNPEQLKAYAGKLRGAIVLTRPLQDDFIKEDRPPASGDLRRQPARPAPDPAVQRQRDQELTAMLQREGAGLILAPNIGEHGTLFVTGRDGGPRSVPSAVIASEHYNLLARLLQQNIPVKVSAEIQARYHEEDKNAYNVIAEIRGADPRIGDEVVMVGAHLDSWHTATGATDNADGVAVAMEAMRILKTLNVRPRRTVRVALWGGEEQGLLGSREYVRRHLAGDAGARDKFSVYFNLDNGYVPIYGFYLEGNQAMAPIMEAWLKPFNDIGAKTATLQSIGSTDHVSFNNAGVPGFQAIHEYKDYDVRTHHTNVDTYERVNVENLKQASVVMASILYHAAMRDERIPRKR